MLKKKPKKQLKKRGRPPGSKNKPVAPPPKVKKVPMIYNTVYKHKEGLITPQGWYVDKEYTTKTGAEKRIKALKKMKPAEAAKELNITETQAKSLQVRMYWFKAKNKPDWTNYKREKDE